MPAANVSPALPQGIRQSASSIRWDDTDSATDGVLSSGENVGQQQAIVASENQDGDIQLDDLDNSLTAVASGISPESPPRQDSTRSSDSFRSRSSGSLYNISSRTANKIEKSENIQRLIKVVGFVAVLFTVIGFFPAFGQYYYSKISWDSSVQSSNQSTTWQEFEMKTQFYQSCQMNKVCYASLSSVCNITKLAEYNLIYHSMAKISDTVQS